MQVCCLGCGKGSAGGYFASMCIFGDTVFILGTFGWFFVY